MERDKGLTSKNLADARVRRFRWVANCLVPTMFTVGIVIAPKGSVFLSSLEAMSPEQVRALILGLSAFEFVSAIGAVIANNEVEKLKEE